MRSSEIRRPGEKTSILFSGSIEYAEQVRHQYEMKRLEAELKGKAQIERENREIYLEQIKLKAEEQRKTVMESIKTAGSVIGSGVTTMLENPNKILLAVSFDRRTDGRGTKTNEHRFRRPVASRC